ncbi:hypothetical protein J6590_048230 [Homalodisca vitripennis]|nr:hypothetical protein J6590_048230 [Homalodisca vitripennis]
MKRLMTVNPPRGNMLMLAVIALLLVVGNTEATTSECLLTTETVGTFGKEDPTETGETFTTLEYATTNNDYTISLSEDEITITSETFELHSTTETPATEPTTTSAKATIRHLLTKRRESDSRCVFIIGGKCWWN